MYDLVYRWTSILNKVSSGGWIKNKFYFYLKFLIRKREKEEIAIFISLRLSLTHVSQLWRGTRAESSRV